MATSGCARPCDDCEGFVEHYIAHNDLHEPTNASHAPQPPATQSMNRSTYNIFNYGTEPYSVRFRNHFPFSFCGPVGPTPLCTDAARRPASPRRQHATEPHHSTQITLATRHEYTYLCRAAGPARRGSRDCRGVSIQGLAGFSPGATCSVDLLCEGVGDHAVRSSVRVRCRPLSVVHTLIDTAHAEVLPAPEPRCCCSPPLAAAASSAARLARLMSLLMP